MKLHPVTAFYLKGNIIAGTGVTGCVHAGGVVVVSATMADVGAFGNYGSIHGKTRRMIIFVPFTDAFDKNNDKKRNHYDKNNRCSRKLSDEFYEYANRYADNTYDEELAEIKDLAKNLK